MPEPLPVTRRLGRLLRRLSVMLDPPLAAPVMDKAARLRARFPDAPEAWIALVADRWPFEGDADVTPIPTTYADAVPATHEPILPSPSRHPLRLRWPRFHRRGSPMQAARMASGTSDARSAAAPETILKTPEAPPPHAPVFNAAMPAPPAPPRFKQPEQVRTTRPVFAPSRPATRPAPAFPAQAPAKAMPRVRLEVPTAAAQPASPRWIKHPPLSASDASMMMAAPSVEPEKLAFSSQGPEQAKNSTPAADVSQPRHIMAESVRFSTADARTRLLPAFTGTRNEREASPPSFMSPWPELPSSEPRFTGNAPEVPPAPDFTPHVQPSWPALPESRDDVPEPATPASEPRVFAPLRPEQKERSWSV